jgi:hypothetical protein
MTSPVWIDTTAVKFNSVRQAIEAAEMIPSPRNKLALVVWHDSLNNARYFTSLRAWQVINRIPSMQILCRKVSFTYLMKQISDFFPSLYTFYPQSFNLPMELEAFERARAGSDRTFIIKPDTGSLGQGIEFVEPGQPFNCPSALNVAQEYIESYLIDNRKFDLRVYCLVASLRPLRIYVYRDGVARFCAEEAGSKSPFARITNVGLNKEHEDVVMGDISQLISDVFARLEREGVDTDAIWTRIDEVVVLSIFSGVTRLQHSEKAMGLHTTYARCFQLLGFDILLDRELQPHVLEINYRPSLDYYRPAEKRMKVGMLTDLLRIALPFNAIQAALTARGWGWTIGNWGTFVKDHPEVLSSMGERTKCAVDEGQFVQVCPNGMDLHHNVYRVARELAKDPIPPVLLGECELDIQHEEA